MWKYSIDQTLDTFFVIRTKAKQVLFTVLQISSYYSTYRPRLLYVPLKTSLNSPGGERLMKLLMIRTWNLPK